MATKFQVYSSNEVLGANSVKYIKFITNNLATHRNAFSTWGSGLKTTFGGNIGGVTKLTTRTRTDVMDGLVRKAIDLGANAIIGLRIDITEMFEGILECVAYGTAVYYE